MPKAIKSEIAYIDNPNIILVDEGEGLYSSSFP